MLICYVFLLVLVGIFGIGSLFQTIKTGAVERQISVLEVGEYDSEVVTSMVSQLNLTSPLVTAHELNTYAKLLQWLQYHGYKRFEPDDVESMLILSTHLRPTWSPTYIELYRLYKSNGQVLKANEYLNFAQLFGPQNSLVTIETIDHVFSNWPNESLEAKIFASRDALKLAKNWRYKDNFNTMLNYSHGKQRICNLLLFNKIKSVACNQQ